MLKFLSSIFLLIMALPCMAFHSGNYALLQSSGPLMSQCGDAELVSRQFENSQMIELTPSILFTNIEGGEIKEDLDEGESVCTIQSKTRWTDADKTRLEQSSEYSKSCEGGAAKIVKSLKQEGQKLFYEFVLTNQKGKQVTRCTYKLVTVMQ